MARYRVLIIEDDPLWGRAFEKLTRGREDFEFLYRASGASARSALQAQPIHVVSIDQNIPLHKGQDVESKYGFELLEDVVAGRPLTRTAVYTAFGNIGFANRSGRLGKTEYFEKKINQKEGALDISDYFSVLLSYISGGRRPDRAGMETNYVFWALDRARVCLPGLLGRKAGELHDATHGRFEEATAAKALNLLLEFTVELAWAQACALTFAVKPQTSVLQFLPTDLSSRIKHLGQLLRNLESAKELGNWRGYVSERGSNGAWGPAGGRIEAAVGNFKRLRNDTTHGNIQALSPDDLAAREADLLSLVDALAYWADRPLMLGVRYHPEDRSRLQYRKLVGESAWPVSSVTSNAPLLLEPDHVQGSIQILHQTEEREKLIDLSPFVSMVDQPGKLPVPAMLIPVPGGYLRRSLATGEDLKSVPLKAVETSALKVIFGKVWSSTAPGIAPHPVRPR